jgi:hypothetical protein
MAKDNIIDIIDPSTKAISAKSAGLIEITMIVFDYVRECAVFYGTEQACKQLERRSFNYIALPL